MVLSRDAPAGKDVLREVQAERPLIRRSEADAGEVEAARGLAGARLSERSLDLGLGGVRRNRRRAERLRLRRRRRIRATAKAEALELGAKRARVAGRSIQLRQVLAARLIPLAPCSR